MEVKKEVFELIKSHIDTMINIMKLKCPGYLKAFLLKFNEKQFKSKLLLILYTPKLSANAGPAVKVNTDGPNIKILK